MNEVANFKGQILGTKSSGEIKRVLVNDDGSIFVNLPNNIVAILEALLAKNSMEYYGVTIDDRPAANAVPVGAKYTAVQTQEIWQSDGTNWVAMV